MRLQTQVAKGSRDDNLLHAVIRVRDTFEELDALQSVGATGSLVSKHTTDDLETKR